MVNAQVTVFADTLGIQGSVVMVALACFLGAALGMVTVLAHTISVVLLGSMRAFGNFVPVAGYLSL